MFRCNMLNCHVHCRAAFAELRRGSTGPGINISASVSDYLGWFVPEYVTSSRVQSPQDTGARRHVSVFQGRSRRNSPKEVSIPPQTNNVQFRSPPRRYTSKVLDAVDTPIGPREILLTQSDKGGPLRAGHDTLAGTKPDSLMINGKVVSVDSQSQSKCDLTVHDLLCAMADLDNPSHQGDGRSVPHLDG